MYTVKNWHVVVARSLLQKQYGAMVLKGRPDKGKYISPALLPKEVLLAFDIVNVDGRYFVDSFKSEDVIPLYENVGAKVKKLNPVQYRISFQVRIKVTHPKQKEYIKNVRRDKYGHFLNKEGYHNNA